jgi:hypothetical protein
MKGVTMLWPVKDEPRMTTRRGTWEYVHDTDDGRNKYLHRECDAVCDVNGHCIMCGASSPDAVKEEMPYGG